jgi:hypothetical protein
MERLFTRNRLLRNCFFVLTAILRSAARNARRRVSEETGSQKAALEVFSTWRKKAPPLKRLVIVPPENHRAENAKTLLAW